MYILEILLGCFQVILYFFFDTKFEFFFFF